MEKYKLINKAGEETLCYKVTIDGFDCYMSDGEIKTKDFVLSETSIAPLFLDGKLCYPEMLAENQWRKVVATTNPNIDIPKVVDEVEKLAMIHHHQNNYLGSLYSFKEGYNKSKETHPFSEEDMIKFRNYKHYSFIADNKLLLKTWKNEQPKIIYYG